MRSTLTMTYRLARRIAIAVIGLTVVLVGVAMIVLPGPALIVIPLGLAILSLEFAWARLWLARVRRHISAQLANNRQRNAEQHRRGGQAMASINGRTRG